MLHENSKRGFFFLGAVTLMLLCFEMLNKLIENLLAGYCTLGENLLNHGNKIRFFFFQIPNTSQAILNFTFVYLY